LSGLKPGPISGARATARAKEEADPCGMTARKAKANANANAKAKANADASANAGVSPLRTTKTRTWCFGRDDRLFDRDNKNRGVRKTNADPCGMTNKEKEQSGSELFDGGGVPG